MGKDYDDGEFYDDEDMDEEDGEFVPEDQRSKFMLILGTSYGVSFLVHVIGLFVLTLLIFFVPNQTKKAIVIAKREVKPQVFDEKLKRDMHKTPKIKAEKPVEKPIVVLEEEVEITKEVPKGTDMSNLSNKNLDSTSVVDAYGVGGGAAGAYGQRWGKGSLSREGGSEGTESAVTAALRWLRNHQSPGGNWDTDGWGDNCKKGRCSGPGHNRGDSRYDVGITGMALLAFLGNGHTHRFGTFKRTVNKGLRWLMKNQKGDGSLGFHEGEEIYNHAIATMALCEAFAVSRDFKLKKYAQRAVDYCIKAQNPGQGWKYGIKPGNNDTSVTGWMVLALKAAKTGGIKVPAEAFSGAQNWFKRATGPSGAVGYQSAGGGSSYIPSQKGKYDEVPCMTAVSVICRIFTGEKVSGGQLKNGAKLLMADPPNWPAANQIKKVNYYYWYYGTYAMFQVGGQKWKNWNKYMQKSLLPYNRKGGCEDGSWDPVGEWCIAGGRVYATAINALTLEIYYRYERANSK
jgi:hypothetical protein